MIEAQAALLLSYNVFGAIDKQTSGNCGRIKNKLKAFDMAYLKAIITGLAFMAELGAYRSGNNR